MFTRGMDGIDHHLDDGRRVKKSGRSAQLSRLLLLEHMSPLLALWRRILTTVVLELERTDSDLSCTTEEAFVHHGWQEQPHPHDGVGECQSCPVLEVWLSYRSGHWRKQQQQKCVKMLLLVWSGPWISSPRAHPSRSQLLSSAPPSPSSVVDSPCCSR
jgi:hypothetical protein